MKFAIAFSSIAVPVFEGDGTFLGALMVTTLTARYTDDLLTTVVRLAAKELRARGFSMTPPPKIWPDPLKAVRID